MTSNSTTVGRTDDSLAAQIAAERSSNVQREELQEESAQPQFPHDKLACLDEKLSRPQWEVPVLPDQELECLLNAAIELSKKGLDTRSEACQRFFRHGLTTSFTKILTDEAVQSWKSNIFHCIRQHCMKLIILCVIKLPQDWVPLLELLAMVFNPYNKFHTYNGVRLSETAGPSAKLSPDELFARPSKDPRNPHGWLVDFINKFGELGGFEILLKRFRSERSINIFTVYAFMRPFGLANQYLTRHTINKYIMPILRRIPSILENLTDDELKQLKEDKTKADTIAAIISWTKQLARRVSSQRVLVRKLDNYRFRTALRQMPSSERSRFNKKMFESVKLSHRYR